MAMELQQSEAIIEFELRAKSVLERAPGQYSPLHIYVRSFPNLWF